jgi:hypothetical protein
VATTSASTVPMMEARRLNFLRAGVAGDVGCSKYSGGSAGAGGGAGIGFLSCSVDRRGKFSSR